MSKNRIIQVEGKPITISANNDSDYICLTDMTNGFEDSSGLIEKWIRNKNTLEFLAAWESLENPNFNYPEFEGIKMEAGTNRFTLSAKKWIERTGAIGITSKTGRYGGTFAHKDIAYEFGSWISPAFKLLLIKEFDRLKREEAERLNSEWDYRRFISKANYVIHTDAIKTHLVPLSNLPKDKEGIVYASEAEILNWALFNLSSKDWKEQNSNLALQGRNIRDYADAHELIVLSNLESINAELIRSHISGPERLKRLRNIAIQQLASLRGSSYTLERIKSPFLKEAQTQTQVTKFDKE